MKEKLLLKIFLVVLVLLLIFNFAEVKAYTGEVDPKQYITLPVSLTVSEGKVQGTISLSSDATGYNIAYQKVDITETQFNNLVTKKSELENYMAGVNEPTTVEQMKQDYYASVPDFTNSWVETNNSSNNVQIDVSEYTDNKIYFVLWVKISNETDTYYNFNNYMIEIENQDKSSRAGSESEEEEWTDFSKAKFELKKNAGSDAVIEISNVTPKEGSYYFLLINNNDAKPNITGSIFDYPNKIGLSYNKDTNKFKTGVTVGDEVTKNVELNQDLYVTVIEQVSGGKENVVSYGNKLDRYEEPKYHDAFSSTFMTSEADQIVTSFTHSEKNDRKMQLKVGKITDNSILQKIKNEDSSGFSDLLNYAKADNGIYDEIVDAIKNSSYALEYDTSLGKSKLINLDGIQNNEYYYLYIKTDDENGKYISNEAVTFAQAKVSTIWRLLFYGTADFEWADFGNVNTNTIKDNTVKDDDGKDDTVANEKIPQTGANVFAITLYGAIVVSIGAISYIGYKKNKF